MFTFTTKVEPTDVPAVIPTGTGGQPVVTEPGAMQTVPVWATAWAGRRLKGVITRASNVKIIRTNPVGFLFKLVRLLL